MKKTLGMVFFLTVLAGMAADKKILQIQWNRQIPRRRKH